MGAIEAGKAFVKFVLDDKGFKKSLRNVGSQLKNIGTIGAAATGPLIAGFAASIAVADQVGSQLDDMSKRTGISAGSLSELGYAAQQSGSSLGTVERGVKKMQASIAAAASGNGTFGMTLQSLGVELSTLQAMNPEQQFLTLSSAIAKIEDPTQRAAMAQKVFGKSGTELLPMLADGAAGIEKLRKEGTLLGVTMSTEDAAAAEKMGDAINLAKQQLLGMAIQIGVALSGPLTNFLNWTKGILGATIAWIKEHPTLVANIATITAVIGGASAATFVLGTAFTVISAHPIIAALSLIAAGLVAVAAYFSDATEEADNFSGALDGVDKKAPKSAAGAPAVPPEMAKIQADAARLAAQVGSPSVQNVQMDSAALSAIDRAIGQSARETATNTGQTNVLLNQLLLLMRTGRGGGLTVGPG